MCGRFALARVPGELAEYFALPAPEMSARYNIGPGQDIVAVAHSPAADAAIAFVDFSWGLLPAWAKSRTAAGKLFNARAETVDEKPAFRNAFRQRRCLIPVTGFYEWRRAGNRKEPYYFHPVEEDAALALGGIWEVWKGDGQTVVSATILTTAANSDMQPIHDRMPVILPEQAWDMWLDQNVRDAQQLEMWLRPFPDGQLAKHRVSAYVNKIGNEGPECIAAV